MQIFKEARRKMQINYQWITFKDLWFLKTEYHHATEEDLDEYREKYGWDGSKAEGGIEKRPQQVAVSFDYIRIGRKRKRDDADVLIIPTIYGDKEMRDDDILTEGVNGALMPFTKDEFEEFFEVIENE